MSGLEGLLTGRTLVKRYRIEEVIGRGGFAVVYRAADERLGRTVAVKVITAPTPDAESRALHQERFEREARAAASLSHPNVVTVHDFGTDPALDIDFLVMEFLHGEDLATYLSRNGRPPQDLAMRILGDAAQGLAVGHRAGLVHRDVKPGNLFLAAPHGEDPFRVCVLDFGIARAASADHTVTRLTQGGIPLSPAYASPEQARGERELTPATDVFGLGVVGYQLLTGEKPYGGERRDDPADWVPRRGVREVEPEVPAEVEAVIAKAMSFAAEDRFPDAAAMARALDEALQTAAAPVMAAAVPLPLPEPPQDATVLQPPAEAPPPPRPAAARAAPPPRRGPGVAVWAMALLVLAGAGAVGVWAIGGGGDSEELNGAEVTLPADVEGEPAAESGGEVAAEDPRPAGAAAPSASGSEPPVGTNPSSPVVVPSGAPGSRPVTGRPATVAPTSSSPAVAPPSATRPASPNPAAPRPTPATTPRTDTAPAPTPADTARPAPPVLLGVPTREPEPRPVPRDTAAAPRSDTASASLPDTARDERREP